MPGFHWPSVSTIPTWTQSALSSSQTGGAIGRPASLVWASNGNVWISAATSGTATTQYWIEDTQWSQTPITQAYAAGKYLRSSLGSIFPRPAILRHQDQARIDEQMYRRAVAEHDEQEAARLLRVIELQARTREERQRLIAEQAERQREERQLRTVAAERAKQLLRENLTSQQLETFDRNGWFVVEGGRTKQKYRIRSGTVVANVDVIGKDERTMHRLCGHVPVGRVPPGDQMLAQKIMIELAEDDFLRVANRHGASS